MTMFTVYGDYGYTSECELFSSDSQNEAIRWANDYVKSGDFGGYNVIEVSYFDRYGEYESVFTLRADDSASYEEDYSEQSAISYNL